jgi:hypothetical protein
MSIPNQDIAARGGGVSVDGVHCATNRETCQTAAWLERRKSRRLMRISLIGSSSFSAKPSARIGARGSRFSDSRPWEIDSHISHGCSPSKVFAIPLLSPSTCEYSTSIFAHAIPCNTPQCPPPRWSKAPKTKMLRKKCTLRSGSHRIYCQPGIARAYFEKHHFGAASGINIVIRLSLPSSKWRDAGIGGESERFLPGAAPM